MVALLAPLMLFSRLGVDTASSCHRKTQSFPLGKGHEVFDAKLLGVVRALQLAEKVGDQRPVTILLDSQAAITRL